MAEPISIIAAILSVAASIKKLMERGNLSKEDAVARYRLNASQQEIKLLDNQKHKAEVLDLLVISEELLAQLHNEADECEKEHIRARKSAKTLTEKDIADTKASGCMCHTLRTVRKHNELNLPSETLDRWWRSYNCPD